MVPSSNANLTSLALPDRKEANHEILDHQLLLKHKVSSKPPMRYFLPQHLLTERNESKETKKHRRSEAKVANNIKCVGNACTIDLMRVARPAWNNVDAFQAANLSVAQSIR